MKVLMLGWEYPPKISGGLGMASQGLAKGLIRTGIEVDFILPKSPDTKTPKRLTLMDAQQAPIKKQVVRQVLEEITEEIRYLEIGTRLMPYLTKVEFERIAHKTRIAEHEVTEEVVLKKSQLVGGYGPGLLQEMVKYGVAVATMVKSMKFDVIHAHDWMTYEAAIMAHKACGKPLVMHVHSTEFDRSVIDIDPKIYEIEKNGLEAAQVIIAVSNKVKRRLVEHYGIKSDRIKVVYNAIQSTDLRTNYQPKPRKNKQVLFFGRLTDQKGPARFLDIAIELLKKDPSIKFTIAGDGHLRESLEEKVKSNRIHKSVKFVGFLSHKKTIRTILDHDLVLLPSVSEPFSLAALEAGALGVPVIISTEAGVAELVKSIKTLKFWDTYRWVKESQSLLNRSHVAHHYTKKVQTEINRLNWKLVADEIKSIYSNISK